MLNFFNRLFFKGKNTPVKNTNNLTFEKFSNFSICENDNLFIVTIQFQSGIDEKIKAEASHYIESALKRHIPFEHVLLSFLFFYSKYKFRSSIKRIVSETKEPNIIISIFQ